MRNILQKAFIFSLIAHQANRHAESFFEEDHLKNTPMSRFSISDAVDKAYPALVNIQINLSTRFTRGIASGSGFVFNAEKGLIATNHHVIESAFGKDLTVTLSDGRKFIGRVHSSDALTDLAIVEIINPISNSSTNSLFSKARFNLSEVAFGDSTKLRVGEWVVALGSPLGMQNTITCGIVSTMNRSASELGLSRRRTDYIQTDASINQGNSGGPLINLDGEVVGINTMKLAYQDGISFAVPMHVAKIVLQQLQEKKRVDRPYLGLRMMPVKKLSHGHVGKDGVIVAAVAKNSPAAQAGLEVGDMLLRIDGVEILNSSDVIRIIGYDVGNSHTFEVVKSSGQLVTYTITSVAATF